MPVTLRQIAEQSGVSPQAVSRILGGHVERFLPETCRRVQEVARALNYRPDPIGRALVRGRTRTIGLLVHGIGGRVQMSRTHELLTSAEKKDYDVYVKLTGRGAGDTERMVEAARGLLDRRVDGLVVIRSTPLSDEARRFFASLSVPMVFVDRGPPRYKARIRYERQPAIDALAEHLASLGHRQAVLFASLGSADFREHKIHPYQRAFARAGVELMVRFERPLDERGYSAAYRDVDAERRGYEAVRRFLAEGVGGVTALCMNNDETAVGALAALREAGVRVPEDMSVAGVDGLDVGRVSAPPLTTIDTPRSEVGRAAFEMLERLMHEPDAAVEPVSFAYQLVPRCSTGLAPHVDRVSCS